jgi:hypothetical protein
VPAGIRERAEATTGADLSGVRVHTEGAANHAAHGLGARAFARGGNVFFGAGEYHPGTLAGDHLIAHELVHTIQQSGAPVAQAKLRDSEGGDAAEREADTVADAVMSGAKAVPTVSVSPGTVSRKRKRDASARPADAKTADTAVEQSGSLSNAYGTFKYQIKKNAGANGCSFNLEFNAFTPEVSASKLTIIQTVKGHKAGGAVFYLNNDSAYYADFDAAGDGTYTDHLKGETDPFYNFEDKTGTDESTGSTGATKTDMTDGPRIGSIGGERGQDFETAPFALSGGDKGEFYGTITWSWKIDAGGVFSLGPVAVHDDVTTSFGEALRKFISKQADLTKTGTTPAPVSLEMPTSVCRELTAEEQTKLNPVADTVNAAANARAWVVARYDTKKGDAQLAHAMAMSNATTVQSYFTGKAIAIDKVRITAVEVGTAKPDTSLIEVSIINT